MPKWIEFREVPAPGVTKRWEVRAKQNDVVIGHISWSTGWRRYVIAPRFPTAWDDACLRDVADFLEIQTRGRAAERTLKSQKRAT